MIPRPPPPPPTSSSPNRKKSVNFTSDEQKEQEDFSSSTVPTWARRGISWKSIREVFDDNFVHKTDDRTEEMVRQENMNLSETMRKYATLYNEVGLAYLNEACTDMIPEDEFDVREQIQRTMEEEQKTSAQKAAEENKNNIGSVAFCFNCREAGHTHSVCPQPRRCYICHDPRHEAFVCVANPVQGSEFFEPDVKCAICGDKGHYAVRCKSRGGPWQGKPGYAHLPDTTYPRPLVIHTGRKQSSSSSSSTNNNNNSNKDSTAPTDAKSAREIILHLVEQHRSSSDFELMKLMREAELFCGSIPLLANDKISGAQRTKLRQALDVLRPAVAGVDLASFGVVLNQKHQGAVSGKKALVQDEKAGRSKNSNTGNVLDDEAALNELRTSSIDFNVVFGNNIERYNRSESSAEFRIGLQKIQAKTGLRPADIDLYDDDEVAAKINRQVVNAARAAQKAHQRALILQKEIDRATGHGSSSSNAARSSSAGSATSSRSSSPVTTTVNHQKVTIKDAVADNNDDNQKDEALQRQQPTKTPLGQTRSKGKNIFKGTAVRHMRGVDPSAAERKARARREAAGEATLMRWTRMLSQGVDVEKVTSEEAASSTNTSLSKNQLKSQAEADLLRLMKAAVNKGDSDVIEGKKLSIPRVQHGTIGRDSIIRTWAAHKVVAPLMKRNRSQSRSSMRQSSSVNVFSPTEQFLNGNSINPDKDKDGVFLTEAGEEGQSPSVSPSRSPRNQSHSQNNNNNTGAGIRLRRRSSITFAPSNNNSPSKPTQQQQPHRRHQTITIKSPTMSPARPSPQRSAFQDRLDDSTSSSGISDDSANLVVDFSLGSDEEFNKDIEDQRQKEQQELEERKKLATPRSNYKNNDNAVDSTIKLPNKCTDGTSGEEPIRNWNAHRVAMLWGKKQEQKNSTTNTGSSKGNQQDEDHVDVWLHARNRYNRVLHEAKHTYDEKLDSGRREEVHTAREEFDSTMRKLGNPPPINRVIDPDIVSKWKGRFQTARIRAGVKDAALKESRLVHRSVVATARLGGAAVCDGATRRAERWLRSHRDVESSEGSTSLISDRASMWTILCHRIAIAAVRVRAKRELAEELQAFLSRLPKGKATQDEAIRMVSIFEDFVYGDDTNKNEAASRDQKAVNENASFADIMMKSFSSMPHPNDLGDNNSSTAANPNGSSSYRNGRPSTAPAAKKTKKTTLDRCMEEWMLGNKRDEAKKKKKLASSTNSNANGNNNNNDGSGDEDDENKPKNLPHYAQAKNVDSKTRKEIQVKLQQEHEERKKKLMLLHRQQSRGRFTSDASENTSSGDLLSKSPQFLQPNDSFSGVPRTASSGWPSGASLSVTNNQNESSDQQQAAGSTSSPNFASLTSTDLSSTQAMLLFQQQNPGMVAAAGATQQQTASHTRPSDLERLLSAPVTSQDVEKLIEKACRESYTHLFDDEDLRRALPSTVTVWAKDDPRRAVPRTQEGESVAAFLRWIVSPAATEGVLGRIISKFTTSAGMFDFDAAFGEVTTADNEDDNENIPTFRNQDSATVTSSAVLKRPSGANLIQQLNTPGASVLG